MVYDQSIPIGFTSKGAANLRISVSEMSNFEKGTRLIIKNNQTLAENELIEGVNFCFSTQEATSSTNTYSLILRAPGTTTDIKHIEQNTQVYVNAKKQITVTFNEIPDNTLVKVYSRLGQLLVDKEITQSTIVLNNISESGVYFVNISQNGNVVTKKVIIN
jgi:membrane-bound inhibitor of C-type lysozyme